MEDNTQHIPKLEELGYFFYKLQKTNELINRYNKTKSQYNLKHLDKLIRQIEENLKDIDELKGTVIHWINNEKIQLEERAKEFRTKFTIELDKLFKVKNYDLKGQLPNLHVGFYIVELNFESHKVHIWFGPHQEFLGSTIFDPQKIVSFIENHRKELTSSSYAADNLLKRIYDSYLQLVNRYKKDRIPITLLLRELAFSLQDSKFQSNPSKANFKEYTRTQFSYDLYSLEQKEIDGKRIKFVTATRELSQNKKDYIWIPTNEKGDGTVISHIVLEAI